MKVRFASICNAQGVRCGSEQGTAYVGTRCCNILFTCDLAVSRVSWSRIADAAAFLADSISGEELGAMLGEMLAGMNDSLCADG